MAEFCLDCWNRLNQTQEKLEDVVLTNYLDLCEGCGEMKQVVLAPFPKTKRRVVLFYLVRGLFVSIWNRMCNIVYDFKRRNR